MSFNGHAQQFTYFFASHTYEWHTGGSQVDERLEQLDLAPFNQIWLGGDLCSEASLKYSTIAYIDDLFDLGAPSTHWALGNHDTRNGNLEWVRERTGRKTYYAADVNGMTMIVMNTNFTPNHCYELDQQYRIIEAVCDTIQHSSHLILLMHHAVWDSIPGLPPPSHYSHTAFPYWNANCFDRERNSFRGLIYPKLIEVQHRGIQVICLTGDMGANGKLFEQESLDGIVFLGCGLNNSFYTDPDELAKAEPDYVLLFVHDRDQRSLSWQFIDLNELLNTES